MFGKIGTIIFIAIIAFALVEVSDANPVIDSAGEFDLIGICLRNCAQCKKMYGSYFEGQMCADGCVKFKGKVILDCEDICSIAPFLNKF